MSTAATELSRRAQPEQTADTPLSRRIPLKMIATTPLVVMALGITLYVLVKSRDLDSVESRILTNGQILIALRQHLVLVGASTIVVLLLAIPLGVLLTRPAARRIAPVTLGAVVAAQSVPSFGLIVIFALTLGLGAKYAIYALIISAFLPVLSNTIAGIEQIDGELKEAASGIGLTRGQILRKVELPLAVPVMLAGLRTAIVWNVGTATVAAFAGAGGLGSIILVGLIQSRDLVTIVGAALTALLAILLDHLARMAQEFFNPQGL